jgi:phosphatidylserine decarboxylase
MKWIAYIPKSYLSWFVGALASLPLPQPLAIILVRWFARTYKIDPATATRSLHSFRSIGDFFTRDLRPELRPIANGVVSPVDGTLRSVSDVSELGHVTQVKGKEYQVSRLLGGDQLSSRFTRGQLWNFYLSPQDAHHIFSPVDGTIVRSVHIPGKLWPVNDWAIQSVDGLFVVNERIVTFIESAHGLVAVVMVGATNVGRIALSYAPFETNKAPWRSGGIRAFDHSPSIKVNRGEKIGTFKMGSSVVVLFESRLFDARRVRPLTKVTYGVALESLCQGS